MCGSWWHARARCCACRNNLRKIRAATSLLQEQDPKAARCFWFARIASNSRARAVLACHSASITIASGRYSNCSDEIVRLRRSAPTRSEDGATNATCGTSFRRSARNSISRRGRSRVRPAIDQICRLLRARDRRVDCAVASAEVERHAVKSWCKRFHRFRDVEFACHARSSGLAESRSQPAIADQLIQCVGQSFPIPGRNQQSGHAVDDGFRECRPAWWRQPASRRPSPP